MAHARSLPTLDDDEIGGVRKPQQLPDVVAGYVREQILSGEFRPGEFLRLERIAEAVGVSNTPVREGLLALRSEGYVELVARRGFMVTPFTAQDVRDIFWMQAQLAAELAARAAESITAEQLDRLKGILDKQGKATDARLGADLSRAFHEEITAAADSPRLAATLAGLVSQLPDRFYGAIETHLAAIRDEHGLLYKALKKRDVRKASALMESHIVEGGEHLIELLTDRGVWTNAEKASR